MFCAIFSVAIQHSCAALVRAIGAGAMAIGPDPLLSQPASTEAATASAASRTKVRAGRIVGIPDVQKNACARRAFWLTTG